MHVVLPYPKMSSASGASQTNRTSRSTRRPAVSEDEQRERRLADEQDVTLYTVAAFTGLRLREMPPCAGGT